MRRYALTALRDAAGPPLPRDGLERASALHVVEQLLNVGAGDGVDATGAERWQQMKPEAPTIDMKCGRLLVGGAFCEIELAQFGEIDRLAIGGPLLCRIDSVRHVPEQAKRFLARAVGRPGRTVTADRIPTRAPSNSVFEHVDAFAARRQAKAESGNAIVPSSESLGAGHERVDLALGQFHPHVSTGLTGAGLPPGYHFVR